MSGASRVGRRMRRREWGKVAVLPLMRFAAGLSFGTIAGVLEGVHWALGAGSAATNHLPSAA